MNNLGLNESNKMDNSIPQALQETISFETFEACVSGNVNTEPALQKQNTNGLQKWIWEKREKQSKKKTALKAVRSGQLNFQIIV